MGDNIGEMLDKQAEEVKAAAEHERARQLLSHYTKFINARPMLLSLLYDVDLLPEQIRTYRAAVSVGVICDVWKAGERGELPAPPEDEAL